MLLEHNPRLRRVLQNALQILAQRNIALLDLCQTYRVRGNPHDYTVNLAARKCSCSKTNCEHFFAAWFAYSEQEIASEALERGEMYSLSESSNDVWRGTDVHICADGYCETATFGYGAEIRCARCGEFYSPAHDETI